MYNWDGDEEPSKLYLRSILCTFMRSFFTGEVQSSQPTFLVHSRRLDVEVSIASFKTVSECKNIVHQVNEERTGVMEVWVFKSIWKRTHSRFVQDVIPTELDRFSLNHESIF